jgi:hypothetical protein
MCREAVARRSYVDNADRSPRPRDTHGRGQPGDVSEFAMVGSPNLVAGNVEGIGDRIMGRDEALKLQW